MFRFTDFKADFLRYLKSTVSHLENQNVDAASDLEAALKFLNKISKKYLQNKDFQRELEHSKILCAREE